MIELILLGIFLGSSAWLLVMISQKAPMLLSLPENLIHESFVTKPPRLRTAWIHMQSLVERRRYKAALMHFLEKALRRIRVWILKSDAFVSRLLSWIQEEARQESLRETQYWQGLREWKKEKNDLPPPEMVPPLERQEGKLMLIRKIFSKEKQ